MCVCVYGMEGLGEVVWGYERCTMEERIWIHTFSGLGWFGWFGWFGRAWAGSMVVSVPIRWVGFRIIDGVKGM